MNIPEIAAVPARCFTSEVDELKCQEHVKIHAVSTAVVTLVVVLTHCCLDLYNLSCVKR